MTTLYSNENYKVTVGSGIDYENDHYLITNVNTGVVEVESRLYPQSIAYCDQLNETVLQLNDPEFTGDISDMVKQSAH